MVHCRREILWEKCHTLICRGPSLKSQISWRLMRRDNHQMKIMRERQTRKCMQRQIETHLQLPVLQQKRLR